MIDNKERQEIVNNLKSSVELHKDWDNIPDSLLLDILAVDLRYYNYNEDFEPWLFNYLADLIDRNTCKMVDCVLVHGSHSVGMYCSSCGAEFEQEKAGFMWKYCPNCGAEVVRSED